MKTKKELIAKLAEMTSQPKTDIEAMLNAQAVLVSQQLTSGSEIVIPGVAKLSTRQRKAMQRRSPQNNQMIDVPAKTVVVLKATSDLRTAVAV